MIPGVFKEAVCYTERVPKLFLPQTTLEEWALADKADINAARLIVSEDNLCLPVVPAVHFLKIVSGADDNKLVSKVKTEQQLQTFGAEQMADSVVLGESAYEVVPGYVIELAVASEAGQPADKKKDTELLEAFLLDKL